MNDVGKRFRFPEVVNKTDAKGKKLICPMASGTYYRKRDEGIKAALKDASGDDLKKTLIENSLFSLGEKVYA